MKREIKVYLMDATTSNSMKSSNPYSGIHETDYVKCLDTMCLNPGCNQGGCMVCIGPESNAVVYDGSSVTSPKNWNNPKLGDPCYALHTDNRNYVVIALEGNGARPSHLGKGFSEDNKMYTLNTIEQHSVCYSVDCRNLCLNEEKSGTLQAKNVGGFSYNYLNPILRRIDDGNVPLVLVDEKRNDSFYVESIGHDIRSTQFSTGGCCDTLTANDYKDPCIVAYETRSADESISNDHRSIMHKQSSGKLYGTGRIKQHAPSDREEQP